MNFILIYLIYCDCYLINFSWLQEATLNTLVFTEVICWFFIGECIGKGSIVGYQV